MRDEPLNIVFVMGPLRFSGAERVILSLANNLVANHKISIIALYPQDDCPYNDYLDNRIQCILLDYHQNFFKRNICRFMGIRSAVKKQKSDVVVAFGSTYSPLAVFSMLGSGIPVVVSERTNPAVDPWSVACLKKILYHLASGVVCQTQDGKEFFSKAIQQKSTVIPNPIAASAIPEVHQGQRRKDIVTVGRLDMTHKNHLLLIRAFVRIAAEFPDHNLVIYGEGPSRCVLEDEVQKFSFQQRIFLPGAIPDAPNRIKDASLFVLSSDTEGMPNALIEAMAVGLPVISTDCPCGGPRFLIQDGENGLLTPVGDVDKMAEAMQRMLNNPEASEAMGKKARGILEILAPEKIARQWEGCFMSVVERDKR